jgi:lipoprotein-anchoring transpeptidase ErfK/SrfK
MEWKWMRTRGLGAALAALAAIVFCAGAANASVRVVISKSTQRMSVYVDGQPYSNWAVSTGRRGYGTPSGNFRAFRLEPRWYSRKYDMAPMHNAVFFYGGYAIHGTSHVGQLGRPASHGCIRLHPANARAFFALVRQYGPRNTRISIR